MVDIVSIIIAVVSFIGTVIAAGIAGWATFYSDSRKRLTEAEALTAKYRDPLLLAAEDLQSRLYNIVNGGVTSWIEHPGVHRDYLLLHTCFLVGQYLAWTHILRREAQFLRFSTDAQNMSLTNVLGSIRYAFRTDSEGALPFMLWTGEQQALGEIMTIEEDGQRLCMGYATFCTKWEDKSFRRWFKGLVDAITVVSEAKVSGDIGVSDQRLRKLQHSLVDLIEVLDPKGVRSEATFTKRCKPPGRCACSACRTHAPKNSAWHGNEETEPKSVFGTPDAESGLVSMT